jgi:hypothetical protein
MTKPRRWIVGVACTGCVVLTVLVFHRVNEFGFRGLFSREHEFQTVGPLTEQTAIELSRRALIIEGYDSSTLAPFEHSDAVGSPRPERFLERSESNANMCRVLWGPRKPDNPGRSDAWTLAVTVTQDGSRIRCRVYRAK